MDNFSISFKVITSATPQRIWQYYTDILLRKLWETDLEEFTLFGELKSGSKGIFKIKNSPAMEVELSTVIIEQELTEQFILPDIGTLYFSHQIELVSDQLCAIKSVIALKPNAELTDDACHNFLKDISSDIMDKAFTLKKLIEG